MTLLRIVLDFESAFGKHPETGEKITLSAMTTEEYVRHPRFKTHGVGLKIAEQPAKYYPAEQVAQVLRLIPWERAFVICHHAHFDGAILSWLYGHRPAFWGCTLSMARALFPHESSSLSNIARLLGVGEKGKELMSVKDKWALTPEEQRVLGGYCATNPDSDINLTARIFDRLAPGFPVSELRLIDWTVRLFTEPLLELNSEVLQEEIAAEQQRKAELLAQVEADKATLMSNDKMAALLQSLGVDPPTKFSPAALKRGEEKLTWAFGKSDEEFKLLLEHEDPAVQAVVEARLGVKSTINETRAGRMLAISQRGAWPVYLTYCAASTFRFGGGDKANPQNLSRGSRLRTAIEAPDGSLLAIRDKSQIEARVLAVWAGQTDLVEQFARGEDVYCKMASRIFGVEVTKDQKDRRFLGKAVVLGCGFGLGYLKFQAMIRVGMLGSAGFLFGEEIADALGISVDVFTARNYKQAMSVKPAHVDEGVYLLHCACAKEIIDRYRMANGAITALWKAAQDSIPALAGQADEALLGVEPQLVVRRGEILMPNGLGMKYHNVRQSDDLKEWTVERRRNRRVEKSKLYGGLIVENGTQSLARIVLTEALLRMLAEGINPKLQVHDELVAVAAEESAEFVNERMAALMAVRPAWMPSLPLASDGGVDKRYVK